MPEIPKAKDAERFGIVNRPGSKRCEPVPRAPAGLVIPGLRVTPLPFARCLRGSPGRVSDDAERAHPASLVSFCLEVEMILEFRAQFFLYLRTTEQGPQTQPNCVYPAHVLHTSFIRSTREMAAESLSQFAVSVSSRLRPLRVSV